MATSRTKRSPSRRARTDGRRTKKRSSSRSRKYGDAAQKKVARALHEAKRGTLRSGRSKKKVTSRKQAIAIGLSEARQRGAKVPPRKRSS